MNNNKLTLSKRLLSFRFAFKGLQYAIKTQHNLWIHLLALLLVVTAGVYLKIATAEWLLCIFAFALVISAELVNTAIEILVDLVSPEKNKKAGIVKDVAAAAVLVCALGAAIIGAFVFIPKIVLLMSA